MSIRKAARQKILILPTVEMLEKMKFHYILFIDPTSVTNEINQVFALNFNQRSGIIDVKYLSLNLRKLIRLIVI